jgi:hypothetical protein
VALGGKQEGREFLPIHGKAERVSIRDSIDNALVSSAEAKNNQKIKSSSLPEGLGRIHASDIGRSIISELLRSMRYRK